VKAEVRESRKAQKDLEKAPKEVIRSYEIWARLGRGKIEIVEVARPRVTAHDYRRKR
jgi:hypothetical protein